MDDIRWSFGDRFGLSSWIILIGDLVDGLFNSLTGDMSEGLIGQSHWIKYLMTELHDWIVWFVTYLRITLVTGGVIWLDDLNLIVWLDDLMDYLIKINEFTF